MKVVSPSRLHQLGTIEDIAGFIDAEDSIEDASVEKTNFSSIEIKSFGIKNATLTNCDMTAAKFPDASWHVTELQDSRCSGMQLDKGTFKDVVFKGCKLDLVNFRFAKLTNVIFDSCVIDEMDFYGAELKNMKFIDCAINGVVFTSSRLHNVDFTEAQIVGIKGISSLKGATINNEQLIYLAPYLASEFGIKVSEQ
jgi:uncharacterized protein YjbI with pentapeptide repeats